MACLHATRVPCRRGRFNRCLGQAPGAYDFRSTTAVPSRTCTRQRRPCACTPSSVSPSAHSGRPCAAARRAARSGPARARAERGAEEPESRPPTPAGAQTSAPPPAARRHSARSPRTARADGRRRSRPCRAAHARPAELPAHDRRAPARARSGNCREARPCRCGTRAGRTPARRQPAFARPSRTRAYWTEPLRNDGNPLLRDDPAPEQVPHVRGERVDLSLLGVQPLRIPAALRHPERRVEALAQLRRLSLEPRRRLVVAPHEGRELGEGAASRHRRNPAPPPQRSAHGDHDVVEDHRIVRVLPVLVVDPARGPAEVFDEAVAVAVAVSSIQASARRAGPSSSRTIASSPLQRQSSESTTR